MSEKFFLDVNIFMYAAGKPHIYKAPCLKILTELEMGKFAAFVNTEIFQEILYRYYHLRIPEHGIDLCKSLTILPIEILSVSVEDIQLSLNIFSQYYQTGLPPRDAIHAATIQNNSIDYILSADKHFDNLPFLQRIDPIAYAAS